MIVWEVVFFISVLVVFHSYVLFPLLLNFITRKKTLNHLSSFSLTGDLPFVSVVMSVYNEEKVIKDKILSLLDTSYPDTKIEFLIGSDASNDKTDDIIRSFAGKDSRIRFTRYNQRKGKVAIINDLVAASKGEVIISTDAKAFFLKDTIYQLVKFFKDERVAAAGGFLINKRFEKSGISEQENIFMDREMWIKYREALWCLYPIGLYGAMYAVKRKFFTPVPDNYLVDDFYVNMKIYEKGGRAVFLPEAIAIENLPNDLSEEFRRKVRIATGNFQNLKQFSKLLFKPFSCLGFNFISHKVLRWLSPFFMLMAFLSLVMLKGVFFYKVLLLLGLTFLFIPVLDFIFRKIGIHIKIFRLITHFIAMNFALTVGLFKSLKGVEKGVWTPSKR